MSALDWGCCTSYTEDDPFTRCTQCKKTFHNACLQIQDLRGNDGNWKCPLCRKAKKGNNDNTPVHIRTSGEFMNTEKISHKSKKRAAPSMSPEKPPKSPITREEVRSIFREIIKEERAELLSEFKRSMMTPITTEIKEMKEETMCFKQSMDFISAQYEDIKNECESNTKAVSALKENNAEIQLTINRLDNRISQLEQQVRLRDIEIQCLPESRNENLPAIVAKISEVIGCNISDGNIERCTRIAKIDRSIERPRSVIVQFDSRMTKDMASITKFNKSKPDDKLNTSRIGLSGANRPIFVMENLSAANKALHAATRKKAKEMGYKFVWVRDGKILVRKNEESHYIQINSMAALGKLV